MGNKRGKKEKIAFVIASVLVDTAFGAGDSLEVGFKTLVSLVRTPQLDEEVFSVLRRIGGDCGYDDGLIWDLYSVYTQW